MVETPEDDPCLGKTPYPTREDAVEALKRIQKNGGFKNRTGYSQGSKISIYACGEHFHHAHHLVRKRRNPKSRRMSD